MRMTLAGLVVLLCPTPLLAHARWVDPPPRNSSTGLKTGPCGNVPPTNHPVVYNAGDTVTVKWEETVHHPGWYRIAFSLVGDQGFDDNVLVDNIPDAPGLGQYTLQITLPDVECEGCSLQLIQVMTDKPQENGDYQKYYSCADIQLDRGTIPVGTPPPDASPTPDAQDSPTPDPESDNSPTEGEISPTTGEGETSPTPASGESPTPDDDGTFTPDSPTPGEGSPGSETESEDTPTTEGSETPAAAPSTQPPDHQHEDTPADEEDEAGGRCNSSPGEGSSTLLLMMGLGLAARRNFRSGKSRSRE